MRLAALFTSPRFCGGEVMGRRPSRELTLDKNLRYPHRFFPFDGTSGHGYDAGIHLT